MDYPFEHPDFQGRSLAIRVSRFLGAARLVVDGAEVKGTRGKFPLRDNQGRPRQLKLKAGFLDPIPKVDLDGTIIDLARSLTWYEYAWMGLPIVLVITGGGLGALFGILAAYSSARIFRSDHGSGGKYALSGLISLGAVAGYLASAALFGLLIAWNTDISSEKALDKIARVANKQLPKMIDEVTELVELEGLEGVLVYHYRLADSLLVKASGETLVELLRPTISTNTCANSDSRRLLENGVTLRYVYSDSNREKVGELDIELSDCP